MLRKIGSGAFGEVFLAESVGELRRQVAIKVLNEEMAKDADIARRLRDEARILSSLNHRAIVRAEDLIRLNDRWCIVMEYVAGCDLAELPRPLPLEVVLEIGEEIASALHKASSSRGLVHRDIKPANVRITPDGDIKLLDFGVARAEVEQREAATQNLSFGTKEYAAPEQFLGKAIPASDIYALAVMLFELATAVRPGSFFNSPERRRPGVELRRQWEFLTRET
ncbi:MAG TPA: serine/threonine-protein kinase, partial [Myxococcota bacterium]|nr:serine/threonine-protein kinase [Myxococcota bacterium]